MGIDRAISRLEVGEYEEDERGEEELYNHVAGGGEERVVEVQIARREHPFVVLERIR